MGHWDRGARFWDRWFVSPDVLSSEDMRDIMNHADYSHTVTNGGVGAVPDPEPAPLAFKRKTKPPTRADLDLLRRLLILRNKLLKEKKENT